MPLPKAKQYKEKMLKDNMVDPQMMFVPMIGMFEKEDVNVVYESTTYKESNCDALIDENGMPVDKDVEQSLYMAAFNYLNRDRIRSVTGDSYFVSPSRNSDSVKRYKTTVAKDIPLYEAKIDEVLNRDTVFDSFKALYKDELALAKADAEKKRKEFKSAKAEFDRTKSGELGKKLHDLEAEAVRSEGAVRRIEESFREGYFKELKNKAGKFLKACCTNGLRRGIDGYSQAFLESFTPISGLMSVGAGVADLSLNPKLLKKISDSNAKGLPIYDAIIDCDAHLQTFTDYWKEKEKGSVKAEKEAKIRQTLYAQATDIIKNIDIISETTLDPDKNRQLHEDGYTDVRNEPFHLSVYAHRGMWRAKAIAEANKVGLSNNWAIDDLGILSSFNTVRTALWNKCRYNIADNLGDFKKYKEPKFDGVSAEYMQQMDDLFDRINRTPIRSKEERTALLDEIKKLMDTGYEKGYLGDDQVESFSRINENVRKRDLLIERGKEPAFFDAPVIAADSYEPLSEETLRKGALFRDFANCSGHFNIVTHKIMGANYNLDLTYRDKDEMNLPALAFEDMDDHVILPDGKEGRGIMQVVDRKAFNSYKKLVAQRADQMEQKLEEMAPKTETGQKVLRILKGFTVEPIRRSLDGYTNLYLYDKVPETVGISAFSASLNVSFDQAVYDKIEKYQDIYPIHDMYIKNDEYLNTRVSYMKEQEKGEMSEKRIEQYREKLYLQATELLPILTKMTETSLDKQKNKELFDAKVISSNEPFQTSIYAARGSRLLYSALEAARDGLKNGWAIDDLGALTMFRHLAKSGRGKHLYSHANNRNDLVFYDPADYPSPECKDYFDRMDALWDKMANEKLVSKDQRAAILTGMQNLVLEGVEKGYIRKDDAETFAKPYKICRERDQRIEKGLEKPFYSKIEGGDLEKSEFEISIYKLETKRSGVFLGRESTKHTKLREAVESMQELIKKRPEEPGGLTKEEYLKEKLERMDAIIYRAEVYADAREGANTPAGKARLKGAKDFVKLAKREEEKLLAEFNKGKEPDKKVATLEELRTKIAGEKADIARQKLENLQAIPKDKESQNEICKLAADILVNHFATSDVERNREGFQVMGGSVIRNRLLKDSSFKKMMNGYMNDKNMTPQKLIKELNDGGAINRMVSIDKKMVEQEKLQNKKQQAKQKVLNTR